MPTLDEELERAQEFHSTQQKAKNNGLVKNSTANQAGQKAGQFVSKAANLGGGSEAAVAGAVAGALKGGGVGNIIKSGLSAWWLWFLFTNVLLGVIFSPTIIGIVVAIAAVVYLDFHFIMSQFGIKVFGPMSWVQKGMLLVANLIVGFLPLTFIAIYSAGACVMSNPIETIAHSTPIIGGLISSVDTYDCGSSVPFDGGRSGGAGARESFDIDIVLTSAYRPGSFVDNDPTRPSAHGRGEAFDVALRNPAVGFRPNPTDPRIAQLISIARELGFNEPKGSIVDEYNSPSVGTTGPHIHIEFNSGQCDGKIIRGVPTDLRDISNLVPMSGVSNPRLRSCMVPFLISFFEKAGQLSNE